MALPKAANGASSSWSDQERIVFDPRSVLGSASAKAVAILQGRRPDAPQEASTEPRAANQRLVQRADLERLRSRLTEPVALQDRDLLTLLAYAIGGDGDPMLGLLGDVRQTLSTLGEGGGLVDLDVLAALERRVAVAQELYLRATAKDEASDKPL